MQTTGSGLKPGGTTSTSIGVAAGRQAAGRAGDVKISPHSNMIYWWIVWVYGYVCALAININHVSVQFSGKLIKFYPSAWLGLSFLLLVIFVIVFTNVRARVLHTFLIMATLALIAVGTEWTYGLNRIFGWVPELVLQMNLAFYVAFSTTLMVLWFIVVFVIDKSTVWRFSSGQVMEIHRLGQAAGNIYDTRGMLMRRLPDDLFRHKILGLGILGLGTGDLVFRPAAPGAEPFVLENVWKVNEKQKSIERLIISSGAAV
jgi:hypothetical protein